MMRSLPNGSITVLHKEYIRDIPQTNFFSSNPFTINPGLPDTFPWLAQIASAYEEYRIRGCVFTFKSTTTPYNQAQQSLGLGTVMMAAQYNVNNPLFQNKRDLENYIGSMSGSPLQSMQFVLQPTGPLKTLYTRTARPNDPNYDPRMYDFARFEIATTGMTNPSAADRNENIGELWVTYEIDLIKPRFRNGSTATDHYMLSSSNNIGNISTLGPTHAPFGSQSINANTPVISANNWTNGQFGLGTSIIYDNAALAGTQTKMFFPDSLANKLLQITIMIRSIDQLTGLAATNTQAYNINLPSFDPVTPCGAYADRYFCREPPGSAFAVGPNASALINAAGPFQWAYVGTFLIQLNGLVGAASTQWCAWTSNVAAGTTQAREIDIIVNEVDPQAFPIKP